MFSDLPGAPGTGWSWLAVAAGIGFWLLARVEAGREGSAAVTSRPTSAFRRFERWLVGVFMAVLVFVLERLVMRQIKKKELARSESSGAAVTLGEE